VPNGLDSMSYQPPQLGIGTKHTRSTRTIRDPPERHSKAGQGSVNVSPMPAWIPFGGWVAPLKQLTNAKRGARASDERPANLSVNPAVVFGVVRNLRCLRSIRCDSRPCLLRFLGCGDGCRTKSPDGFALAPDHYLDLATLAARVSIRFHHALIPLQLFLRYDSPFLGCRLLLLLRGLKTEGEKFYALQFNYYVYVTGWCSCVPQLDTLTKA